MADSLAGLYPAFLTPLQPDGSLNHDTAQRLLQHLLRSGVDGVYIAGTTGEGLRLPVAQRKALLESLMPVLPDGKRMLVHVGAASLADTVALAQHAASAGAHAISSLPPAGDAAGIFDFYRQLAQESPLPLIVYYFPKAAPHAFQSPRQLLEVCDLPNVAGVKFTDFNMHLLHTLVDHGMVVFNGYDEALAAGLLMGAQGGIGSTYNIAPAAYLHLYRCALAGNWEEARQAQFRLNRVIDTLLGYPFFPALRSAMRAQGFDCGPMKSGETLRSPADAEALQAALQPVLQALAPLP